MPGPVHECEPPADTGAFLQAYLDLERAEDAAAGLHAGDAFRMRRFSFQFLSDLDAALQRRGLEIQDHDRWWYVVPTVGWHEHEERLAPVELRAKVMRVLRWSPAPRACRCEECHEPLALGEMSYANAAGLRWCGTQCAAQGLSPPEEVQAALARAIPEVATVFGGGGA